MKLIGFNLTKIHLEKHSDNFSNLKIDTNIEILQIQKIKQDLFKAKDEFIGVDFLFTINYAPKIANLEFKGKVLLSVETKKSNEILRGWEKKKVDEDFRLTVFNIILRKSSVKALQIEEDLNLPFHINLPRLSKENTNSK